MDRLLFSSLAAAKTQSTVRAQLTNDLANVSTPGFKKSFNHVLLKPLKSQLTMVIKQDINRQLRAVTLLT